MKDGFFSGQSNIVIRIRFYVIFGLIGGVIFFLYALSNVVAKDYFYVILEGFLSLFSFYLSYVTYKSRSLKMAISFGIIPIFIISLTNFIVGGYEGTGILWTYVLPLVVIFIAGSKRGIIALTVFLIITLFHFLFLHNLYPNSTIGYSTIEYITFFISFSTVSVMTYLFQNAWDTSERYLSTEKVVERQFKEDLVTKVEELEQTKLDLEEALEKTKETNIKLQKINNVVIGRELKMRELKNKLKSLDSDEQNAEDLV